MEKGKTWFGQEVPMEKIRSGTHIGKYQKISGSFQKFTESQEKSLIDLCVWLCKNGTDVNKIFGHDETAPKRKNDPGLSLSMKMDDFRILIGQKLKD